jgi:hypothetical protein
LDPAAGIILGPTYDSTLKLFPIGNRLICGVAGNAARAATFVSALDEASETEFKVTNSPEFISKIVTVLEGCNSSADPELPHGVDVLVGFCAAESEYGIIHWNDTEGLKACADGVGARGPLIIGSGSGETSREVFLQELDAISKKDEASPGFRAGKKSDTELFRYAHVLGAAFTNAYLGIAPDRFTGGGALVLTLNPGGVKNYEVQRYRLKQGQVPGEGRWEKRLSRLLTASRMVPGGQGSKGRLLVPADRPIEGLLVDHKEQLSALIRLEEAGGGEFKAIPFEEASVEAREALIRQFGIRRETLGLSLAGQQKTKPSKKKAPKRGNPKQGKPRRR